jgi:hypothetical protein
MRLERSVDNSTGGLALSPNKLENDGSKAFRYLGTAVLIVSRTLPRVHEKEENESRHQLRASQEPTTLTGYKRLTTSEKTNRRISTSLIL